MKRTSLTATVAALLLAGAAAAQLGPGPFAAFPTQSATDGRFLGFGCAGIATFEQNVTLGLAAPADDATFTVNFFDGDTGAGGAGAHWDEGNRQLIFSLYADPLRTGSTDPGNLIASWSGNDPNPTSGPLWTASAATMPDNDWWAATITNTPLAKAPSGNYFYNLVIGLDGSCDIGEVLESNVKVAASSPMTFLVPRFGLVAPLRQIENDGPILYPDGFPPADFDFVHAPTTYDGTFEFFLNLPGDENDLRLYDGDFDFGTAGPAGLPSGTLLTPCVDFDDPDTPFTYSGFPFSTTGAALEGINSPGNPADDSEFDIFRRGEVSDPNRVGCVRYEVTDPDGNVYRNDNPSGSFEWEQFRIATPTAVDTADADHVAATDTLPGGIWKVKSIGLDLSNLNFWFIDSACATFSTPDGLEPACPAPGIYLVGDTVWRDSNNDGIQDPGEPGIPGVKLELFKEGGTAPIATAVTGDTSNPNWAACVANNTGLDLLGLYCFGVDEPGVYIIRVAAENFGPGGPLEGLTSTTGGEELTDEVFDDNVLFYDFGYHGPGKIGDRVWSDADSDGIQGFGETGINGVTLTLLDSGSNVLATQVTSGDGNYLFSDLPFGTYSVRVETATLPPGSVQTYDFDGLGTPNIATAEISDAAESNVEVDFGYQVPVVVTGSLGDRVWNDLDADGFQDAGELGLNNVTVTLLDGANTVLATTVTSGDGNYTFANLSAGTYKVRVETATLPAGFFETYDLDGLATPNIATAVLGSGENRTDVDFGYRGSDSDNCVGKADGDPTYNQYPSGHAFWMPGIGTDFVFTPVGAFHQSGDGTAHMTGTVRSAANPAKAFTVDVVFTGFTTTAGPGSPHKELLPGAYVENGGPIDPSTWWYYTGFNGTLIGIDDYAGATLTIVRRGPAFQVGVGANGKNLNFGASGWFTWTVVTQPSSGTLQETGDGDINVDIFTCPTGSLGDRVWNDTDGDGVQDVGETGINGVTVTLLDGANNVLATTTTAGDGNYLFANLAAGTYKVRVEAATLPAGVAPTFDLDGTGTPHIATVVLAAGQNRTDVDFGYRGNGSLGDRVWKDTDADGIQDAGETGINGVTVTLLDGANNVLATTTTAGDGNYLFANLTAGTYKVRVESATLPAGLAPTFDLDGTGTPHIATVVLAAGQNRTDVDFGYRGTGSLGDRVWRDTDADGIQDAGETGINGVTVTLLDGANNVLATTTTTGDGNYTFSNLAAGTYKVRVESATLPGGLAPTFDLDGTGTPHIATATLAAGQNRTDVDFGYRNTGSLGDRVWKDTDADGIQDIGETGINGVTVTLLDGANNVLATTTTTGDGNYTFGNLAAGTYKVRVESATLPAGLAPTFDLDGTGTPHIATATLTAGQNRTDVDFGYRNSGSLGDRVWKDTDADGVQDAGETGINGVTVTLLSGATVLATTTTSGDGNYTFANLAAGTYTVRVESATLPAGLAPTFDLDGTGTPHVATAALTAGQNRTDVDFGYRNTGSLGDRVWNDADGDGVQDAGETGINGVTVTLLSGATVLATTTTSGDGNYTFANLAAGTYTVRVESTTLPAGLAATFDLDGTGTPHVATVALAAGQSRTDVDFGYRNTGSLGDRVWNDADGDGIQDASETGLNGVTVTLLSGSTVLATTITSGNGNYTFANLAAGTYTVRVESSTLPAGYTQTFDLDGTGTPHTATVTLAAGQSRTDVDFGYRAPVCAAGYFKDTFTTASFSNNEGTLSWSGAWIESDAAGTGVSSGNVTVGTPYSGYLILDDNPDTGTQPSAARQVNLSGFVSATLSFDFHTTGGTDPDDAAVIEISKDGGATYTVLETITGLTGTNIASRTYNITAYMASNTRIRFRISNLYGADDEMFKVDQVRIDGSCSPPTGSIGDRVWKDSDGDGAQDGSEPGLNGVTVQLLNSSNTVLATQTTSGNGNYLFSGLAAGTYKVKVVSSSLPAGYTQTFDLDGTGTAHVATVSLAAGQNRTDADFGYRPPACTAGYFKDTFTTASFSNNEGTLSWTDAWVESDVAGSGVSSGNVTVGTPYSGYLILDDNPDTGTEPSAARQANLSGFSSATLSFDFHTRAGVDPDDAVVVEVSKNGGTSYTVLETITGLTGTNIASRTYNITSYIASNTRIRFRVSNLYGGDDELFKVDQVRIDAACN